MTKTMLAANFNPNKHLRRASALREQNLAGRIKALAEVLPASRIAKMLNLTKTEVEQIAARYGFTFNDQQEEA